MTAFLLGLTGGAVGALVTLGAVALLIFLAVRYAHRRFVG